MNRSYLFYLLLLIISIGGLLLRLYRYDRLPPFRETSDELHYAWGGLTWLKTGTPGSWSWYESYKHVEKIEVDGTIWDIKFPLIEKPPLYFLASGISLILLGSTDIYETRIQLIRVLPLVMSISTLVLTGILARKVFSQSVGLVAALFYAMTPTIILANRLSVSENLLTPFMLLGLLLTIKGFTNPKKIIFVLLAGITGMLAFLTKQVGISLGLTVLGLHFARKEWKKVLTIVLLLGVAILLYGFFAVLYDWQLFILLQQEVQRHHAYQGVPEMFFNIFRHLTIIGKDRHFLDATILLGYLFLFTSPFRMFPFISHKHMFPVPQLTRLDYSKLLFLSLPLMYVALLILGESGSTPYTYWGWYVFPLFPFAVICLAEVLVNIWKQPVFLPSLLLIVAFGSSAVRSIFLILPWEYHRLWQVVLAALFLLFFLHRFIPSPKLHKLFLTLFFLLFIAIQLYSFLNYDKVYFHPTQS